MLDWPAESSSVYPRPWSVFFWFEKRFFYLCVSTSEKKKKTRRRSSSFVVVRRVCVCRAARAFPLDSLQSQPHSFLRPRQLRLKKNARSKKRRGGRELADFRARRGAFADREQENENQWRRRLGDAAAHPKKKQERNSHPKSTKQTLTERLLGWKLSFLSSSAARATTTGRGAAAQTARRPRPAEAAVEEDDVDAIIEEEASY